MATTSDDSSTSYLARAALAKARTVRSRCSRNASTFALKLPPISESRLGRSLSDRDQPTERSTGGTNLAHGTETYLYLAYGSNLAASTFQGVRGVRPLAATNVAVPDLKLTFDLPGLPYTEPCFANTTYRNLDASLLSEKLSSRHTEISPLLVQPPQTSSTPVWRKPLIGTVYEVTPTDYAHIVATEGGGASYLDILITCHPLLHHDPTVPTNPSTPAFKAHTLLAPPSDLRSANPLGYAQPSSRYLELIRTGAAERDLPAEYREEYLDHLVPYTITTQQQRLGQFVFLSLWGSIIAGVFGLARVFSDEEGKVPGWLGRLLGSVFEGVWHGYDGWMKGVFGEGERSVVEDGDGDGDGDGVGRRVLVKRRLVDEEKR